MSLLLAELVLSGLEAGEFAQLPTHRRIFELIRAAILNQRLGSGAKLPSTRDLAVELDCSRNTVLVAYEQLLAEGYIEARTGSGTYVADTLPALIQHVVDAPEDEASGPPRALSRRGTALTAKPANLHYEIQEFVAGTNDFSVFPFKLWQKLQNRHWRLPRPVFMDYAREGGYRPLQEALADYLRVSRSVRLAPEQIIITSGTQQSMDLCALMLTDTHDLAWMENPGYWGARRIFESNELNIRPIPVDAEGMNPGLDDLETNPRLIYVTPSHQYPTDVVMSLSRRRLLLEFAARKGAWIIEDDYDSEFRYRGRPLASLQGLDEHDRVIYLGTFSKVLYPGIRIGYMVVPPDLVDAFRIGLSDIHRPGQVAVQAALADFVREGHFATHLRNLRTLYGKSRAFLQSSLQEALLPQAHISGADTGLHLVIHLPDHCNDQELTRTAASQGFDIKPLSGYYIAPPVSRGVVVGYGYTPPEEIAPAAQKLAKLINTYIREGGMAA